MSAVRLLHRLLRSDALRSTLLIRLIVGGVFVSEGIQKFLEPATLGVGCFATIGIPWPDVSAPFVGVVEFACAAFLLVGLATRPAAIPLIITVVVAIGSTKIPILLGHGFWSFTLRELPAYGFWSMAHEARTDCAMFLGSIYLLIVGGGAWSIDDAVGRIQRP